jgi:DNA-binding GntR family transcriptional regulator
MYSIAMPMTTHAANDPKVAPRNTSMICCSLAVVVHSMLRTIHARANLLRGISLTHKERWRDSIAEIRVVLAALVARDPHAAWAACIAHVQAAAAAALSALD